MAYAGTEFEESLLHSNVNTLTKSQSPRRREVLYHAFCGRSWLLNQRFPGEESRYFPLGFDQRRQELKQQVPVVFVQQGYQGMSLK